MKKFQPPPVPNDPTREPVNLQSALIMRRASWIERPLPPESPPVGENERLKTENTKLKQQITDYKYQLGAAQKEVLRARKLLVDKVAELERETKRLERELANKAGDDLESSKKVVAKSRTLAALASINLS